MTALCAIGPAVLEVIGLNPQDVSWEGEGSWPAAQVFQRGPFYQPTGPGEEAITLRCLTWPHVMGGLDTIAILKELLRRQAVVPYVRMGGALLGQHLGSVFIQKGRHGESKHAPDGIGRRHEVEIKIVFVGQQGTGEW